MARHTPLAFAALAVSLLAAAPAAAEDWIELFRTPSGDAIYTSMPRATRSHPDWVVLELKFEYSGPTTSSGPAGSPKILSARTTWEIDCAARKTRELTSNEFTGRNLTGQVITIRKTSTFDAVTSGQSDEEVLNVACAGIRLPVGTGEPNWVSMGQDTTGTRLSYWGPAAKPGQPGQRQLLTRYDYVSPMSSAESGRPQIRSDMVYFDVNCSSRQITQVRGIEFELNGFAGTGRWVNFGIQWVTPGKDTIGESLVERACGTRT